MTCQDQTEMFTEQYYTDNQDAWLAAVMEDDVETVRGQLQQACDIEKHLLLDGWISSDSFWSNLSCQNIETKHIISVQRPLSLATVYKSYRVISELYKAGIDISQTDKLGNNVIHTLVIHESRQEVNESKYLEVFNYFARLLTRDEMSKLLLAENTSGLRPVELAANFQTFHLVEAIFKSPGLCLNQQTKCCTIFIDLYDVTDYECDLQRRPWAHSPMFLLKFLKCTKMKNEFTTEFFTKGLIGKWLEIQKKIYLPFIILWAVMRLLVIFTALLSAGLTDSVAQESEVCGVAISVPESVKTTSCVFLILTTTAFLLYDMYDVICYHRLNKPWSEAYMQLKGHQVVRFLFYRIQQLTLGIVILTSSLNRMSWHLWKYSLPIYPTQMLFVAFVTTSIWSLLYFVQLMPVIGTYVIATQRMLYSLGKFSIIIFIFVFPFMVVFPKFVSKNDDGTCPDEYNSAVSSWYTSFTSILNMNDFRSFDAPSRESLWLVHVFYVTVIAILTLNFLIAIFADSYTDVANNPEVVANVQWMEIIATIDFRIPRCLYPLVRWLKRRYFTCIDGRLYVTICKTKWTIGNYM